MPSWSVEGQGANSQRPLAGGKPLGANLNAGIDQRLLDGIVDIQMSHDEGEDGVDTLEGLDEAGLVKEVNLDPCSAVHEQFGGRILEMPGQNHKL